MKAIGLVGCGNWGRHILRDLLSLGAAVHVADTHPDARNQALLGGASTTTDDLGRLPACDGYVVAVPIPDLAPVCEALLPRGKPVFAEKTLATSLQALRRLEDLGGQGLLFAMHKWRYHPGIRALRNLLDRGVLGEIQELHTLRQGWTPDFHGGDAFWTLAIHDLTIVEHLLDEVPQKIRSIHSVRDASGLAVGFTAVLGGSPSVVLSVHGRHWNKASSVSLHGTQGSAGLKDAYADHILWRDGTGEHREPIDTTFPLLLELREFVGHLAGGAPPRCTLAEAGRMTRRLLALREATEHSRETP